VDIIGSTIADPQAAGRARAAGGRTTTELTRERDAALTPAVHRQVPEAAA
jgi:hypothetical protein